MEDGHYVIPAIQKFSWTCRDYHENAWQLLNPYLLDIIFVLHHKYCKDEISILSGYRTPKTNALREEPQKVETPSANLQHARANALDIRLPGVANDRVALDLATVVYGGVGIYP